jgi:DNA repair protein RadC
MRRRARGRVGDRRAQPSGSSEPSLADLGLTQRIQKALAMIDVKVVDHLIVGETITSMAERGAMGN